MKIVEVEVATICPIDEDIKARAFKDLRHDFEYAKDAKTEIDDLINEWNDLYYGIKRNEHGEVVRAIKTKSSIVMKEVAKQIEWQKPNIIEPFLSTRQPISLTHPKSEKRARRLEKWANHEFTTEFDRDEFYSQATDVMLREGTVWVQSFWENKEENERIVYPRISMQELMSIPEEPTTIDENEDGTFKVEYNKKITTRNNPSSEVQRNEHIFPDPGARTDKELRFMSKIELMTMDDVKNIPGVDSNQVAKLKSRITSE